MKNNLCHQGFVVKFLLGLIAVLIIVGGFYLYKNKKVEAPIVVNENQEEDIFNKEIEKEESDKKTDVSSSDIYTNSDLKKFVREKYSFYAPKEWTEYSTILKDSGEFTGCELYSISYGGDGHRMGGAVNIYLDSCFNPLTMGLGDLTKENIRKNGYYIFAQYNDDSTNYEQLKTKEVYKKVIETFTLNKETMSIKVYFGDTIDAQSCHTPSYVERIIPKTTAVARASIEELLKGPTEAEKLKDYYWTGLRSGISIKSISINNGVASLDLSTPMSSSLNDPNKGACGAIIALKQIENTLKQFSTIKSVIITANGGLQDMIDP